MTCDDFQLRLTAYSLGELDSDELQAARDHVAGCDDCASRALLDRQLTALLRGSAVPAPEATRAAVLTAVRAEAGRAGAGTGSPWPPPCWPRPRWSPRPCWWCRPPTRAAPWPRPGTPTTPWARTGSAPPVRPRPTGCSRSWGRPRALPTWTPTASTRTAGRPATWPGTWPRWPSTATPRAAGSPSCAGGATCRRCPAAPATSSPPTPGAGTPATGGGPTGSSGAWSAPSTRNGCTRSPSAWAGNRRPTRLVRLLTAATAAHRAQEVRMPRRGMVIGVLVGVLALAAAGCGGGDDNGGASAAATTAAPATAAASATT